MNVTMSFLRFQIEFDWGTTGSYHVKPCGIYCSDEMNSDGDELLMKVVKHSIPERSELFEGLNDFFRQK